MDDKINSEPKWLLQIGSCESIVTGDYLSIFLSKFCELFYIDALNSWVRRSFEIDHSNRRISFQCFFCLIQITQVNYNAFNSQSRQQRVEHILGSTIKGIVRKDFASFAKVAKE